MRSISGAPGPSDPTLGAPLRSSQFPARRRCEDLIVPCYTGEDEDPDALRPLREPAGLVSDSVRRQGFLEQQHIFDPGYGVDRNYWKGHFVGEFPDELIDDLLGRITALSAVLPAES